MSNSSILSIDRTLSGATTPGQSGPGSDVNEEVLYVHQSSRTEASPSDISTSYPGHSLVGVFIHYKVSVVVFYSPSQLGFPFWSSYIYLCVAQK